MNRANFLKLIACIALCELAGVIGSVFTFPSIASWYAALNKPFFSPPNFVFGPVWTALYFLMGVALYLVWVKATDAKLKQPAYTVFALQLFLNVLWSVVFFGLHSLSGGFAVIILLWLSIAATIYFFSKISKKAAWLLSPYLAWVTVASALNYAVMALNP
ncbi:MAG: TspO/MBR family protein [Candidatus Diapherotrites archaeon]